MWTNILICVWLRQWSFVLKFTKKKFNFWKTYLNIKYFHGCFIFKEVVEVIIKEGEYSMPLHLKFAINGWAVFAKVWFHFDIMVG